MQLDGSESLPDRRIKTAFKAIPNCTEMLSPFHWLAALRSDCEPAAATRKQAVGRILILRLKTEDLSLHCFFVWPHRMLIFCVFARCGYGFKTFMGFSGGCNALSRCL